MRPWSEPVEERRLKTSRPVLTLRDLRRVGPSGSSDAPRKLCSVRKQSGSNNKCFFYAKARRQLQSAQSERKSTPPYSNVPKKPSTSLYPTIT
ncbi:hypothetical protein [Lysinibacillus sp. G4S2]|uniref:hypothetical protein n=1 Tax=Lysinibacillus sp. G4S2 TaxID=3055859 RepID=UPI0025A0BA62|nr:hypothetical protein [Lysinibacillus sp. G4S2]MDM5246592.1 hypothetical protein [Lysinibacillus sp. G4S2]